VGVVISYRLDRFFYLLVGRPWAILRPVFFPLFLLLRLLSANHQIHYRANIGKGLHILHPALGVVVSGKAIIGQNLILTGGNCIGGRESLQDGDLCLGDDVSLGANAVVLGPISIGDDVVIGAGAVVIDSAPSQVVLVGVPARVIRPKISVESDRF
jgi:serine acetyltransferase